MSEFSDLLRRAKRGDAAACASLWARVAPAVRATARRHLSPTLRRRFDSGDLAQSVFGEYLRSLPRVADLGEPAFRQWLRLKTESKVIQKLRRTLRTDGSTRERSLPPNFEPPDDESSPSSYARVAERRNGVERALGGLDELSRTIVHLRVEKGLPFAEIAELLGLPGADAARKRHARALVSLRVRLARPFAPREPLP